MLQKILDDDRAVELFQILYVLVTFPLVFPLAWYFIGHEWILWKMMTSVEGWLMIASSWIVGLLGLSAIQRLQWKP